MMFSIKSNILQTKNTDILTDSLDKLIANHHPCFPPVERHDVDRKKVDKLFQRTNNTSARSDGIPFSLYKTTQEKYFDMWVELI